MLNNKNRWPLVIVEWIDSCEPAVNAEVEPHEIPEPQYITQVGILIQETELSVSVAGASKEDPVCFDYVITIPRVAIKSMQILTPLDDKPVD